MDHLPTLVAEARDAVQAAESMAALDELRVRYLGKKGEITALLKGLGKLPPRSARPPANASTRPSRPCRRRSTLAARPWRRPTWKRVWPPSAST